MHNNSTQNKTHARWRVLQALYQWQLAGHAIKTIEEQFLETQDMRKVDILYFQQLLHGIPQQLNLLNGMIKPFIDREVEQLDPTERAILYIGCYELYFCKDIPWRVVLNESIELAKKFGADKSHKYINGILDRVAHGVLEHTSTPKIGD